MASSNEVPILPHSILVVICTAQSHFLFLVYSTLIQLRWHATSDLREICHTVQGTIGHTFSDGQTRFDLVLRDIC